MTQQQQEPGSTEPVIRRRQLQLDDPLQYVGGVGPQAAAALQKLGIGTVEGLLRHYPRRWEDRTRFMRASDVRGGEYITVCGAVRAVSTSFPRPRLPITRALIDDAGSAITLVWFNQPYLEKNLRALSATGRQVVAYGQARRNGWSVEIQSPEWEAIGDDGDTLSTNRIVPVYPATEGLRQGRIRRIVDTALRLYLPHIEESLPADVIARHGLTDLQTAIRSIHFPECDADLERARRRLVFEEFLVLQVALALRRHANVAAERGVALCSDVAAVEAKLARALPFALTGAQERAIREIAADVQTGRPMNRLLQGDVGSGKTVVALAAMLMAIESGYQAALMAPTEILAQQHAISLRRILEPLGLTVELAVGSLPEREKAEVRGRIGSGKSEIAVGTHALIQDGFEFARLGLAVIDEQHRFGVLQRQALRNKGTRPHVLVMSATPIPRTLALTLYGDLDVSVLDELPPGRKPITTHWKPPEKRGSVYDAARRLLQEGRQIYVVCPLVEESEKLQAKSATQLCKHIAEEALPEYRVGLLHGQMRPDEKDSVMARFKAHELDVLVATTVIEVGIDVPNACAIIVEDAHRFGLAQLHQLRGRVGRGKHASYCVLIADPRTDDAQARMDILTATTDGFRIAEEDLKLRGPGEFFGTRQSGMPELAIANVIDDLDVLLETRETAKRLVEADPTISRPEHRGLHRALARSSAELDLATIS